MKTKRRIGFLLAVCMVLSLTLGFAVPTTAADGTGGGEIVGNGKGVLYRFADVRSASGAVSYYNYYQTGDGIVFADYNGGNYPAEISNDADGNLCAKINGAGRLELTFVSGFAYPDTNGWGAFYDINALAIRYRVLGETRDGTAAFTGTGNDLSSGGSLELRADGGWVETVCALTPTAEGRPFGNWKVNGDNDTNLNSCNKLNFSGLTEGTTLVIEYIGLFQTVEAAEAAQAALHEGESIRLAKDETYTFPENADGSRSGRVIRLTGIQYESGFNWKTDSGVTQLNPHDDRDFSNDANGNLVIVTKRETVWSPICLSGAGLDMVWTTLVELKYKTTDADGNTTAPTAFTTENVTVQIGDGEDKMATVKEIRTTEAGDGWYVTRIYLDGHKNPTSGTVGIGFPTDTATKYVIDYIGFFNTEAAAEANAKRDRVFDGDAVRLLGAQAKKDGRALRLIGVIDDYDFEAYEEFGFKLCLGNKVTETVATGTVRNYVYKQILADGVPVDLPTDCVTGQGEDTAYFTYCVNDIPESAFTDGKVTFLVCAYAKIGGAEICGPTYTVVYDCNAQTVTCQ